MNVVCIRQTDLPGATSLFGDLVYRFDRVSRFYAYPPRLIEAKTAAAAIEYPAERRSALIKVLSAQNAGAGAAVEEHLELLEAPDTVVVATGQQVGLFGGPVFSIYKALTAAKYASELRSKGQPAVAVFWLATEDHDLEEVDHAWVFNGRLDPHRIAAITASKPGRPVGEVALKDDPTESLADLLIGLPDAEAVTEKIRSYYRAGASLGEAFRGFIRDLLAPYGLITLDPMDPSIRQMAAPFLSKAVAAGPELIEALLERGHELEAAGYHQQVKVDRETSLLFRFKDGRRIPLKRQGSTFSGGGDTWTQSDLVSQIADSPEAFSPNALLRPVMQDYLMPTALFIGGPAELGYLAQSGVLYDRLLGRRPVMMPRAGFTVLDHRALKLLNRYGLNVPDCFVPFDQFKQGVAEVLTPHELQDRFDAENKTIASSLERLHESLGKFDPTLAEAFDRSRRKITYQLSKIKGKTARESLRRSERGERDAVELAELIFPHKTLQERFYSAIPFLARYGDRFTSQVYDAIKSECLDHQVLAL